MKGKQKKKRERERERERVREREREREYWEDWHVCSWKLECLKEGRNNSVFVLFE